MWRILFTFAVWAMSVGVAQAQAPSDPREVVQRYVEAVNRRDVAGIVATVTDDHLHEGGGCMFAPGGRCVGKEAFRQQLERGVAQIPTIRILDLQVSGNTVTIRGESRPPSVPEPLRALGVERFVEIEVFEIRDGKIAVNRTRPDLNDPQTARAVAFMQSRQAPPAQLPRTGGLPVWPALALGAGAMLLTLGLVVRRRIVA